MKRTRISNCIEYIEPDLSKNAVCCAGVIVTSKPKIFIDTHMGREDSVSLLLEEKPDLAFISHYHLDHSAWAGTALSVCRPRVFVPEGEEDRLQSLDVYVDKAAPLDELKPLFKTINRDFGGYQEIKAFDLHHHHQIFTCKDTTFTCIKSPGHSPSHTCFYFPDERTLFFGDLGIGTVGPFYGFKDCDLRSLVESILMLKRLSVEALLTSHEGLVTSNIDQALNNGLRLVLNRERLIRQRLDQGKNKQAILNEGICYPGKNKSHVNTSLNKLNRMWDSAMFDQHLDILLEGGLCKIFPELRKVVPSSLT